MSKPCVSTAQAPTNAKKKALVEASHPKRVLEKSGKLVSSPAKARFSERVASRNHRMPLIPSTPAELREGVEALQRRRRPEPDGQRLREDEEAERGVGEGQRRGGEGGGVQRVEAQEAAEGRARHEPEAEGGPDQAKSPGPVVGGCEIRYVGLSGCLGAAGSAGQQHGREEQGERLRHPEQEVSETGTEEAGNEDRTSPNAVGEAAQKRTAHELGRRVGRAEQADQGGARSVLARVEREERYDEPVADHVHEDRDEDERQRR